MFDQLEARVNRAAMAKLANATALIGGKPVRVIFDGAYRQGMVGTAGMGAAMPQMTLSSADVPSEFIDSTIQIDGVSWVVADRQPDGARQAGLTVVFLEQA